MVTAEQIQAFIRERAEPTLPFDSILAYLRRYNGKKLTKRDETRMQAEIDPSIEIRHTAGMVYIEHGGYSRSKGNAGGSILVAYCDGAPTIDAEWVEKRNPHAFSARDERNAKRAAISRELCERLAAAINQLQAAKKEIATLVEYGGPFDSDCYAIRKEFIDVDP